MKITLKKAILLSATAISMLAVYVPANATSIYEVFREALHRDYGFKNAVYTYMQTKQAVPLAYSNLLPQVSLQTAYTNQYSNVAGNTYKELQNVATLTQPIFNWSYFSNISVAKATVAAGYASYVTAKQNLIYNVIVYYCAVLQNQKLLDIDQNYLSELKKAYELITAARKETNAQTDDASQIQSSIDQQSMQIISDKKALSESIQDLRSITHTYFMSLQGPSPVYELQPLEPESQDAWANAAAKGNLTVVTNQANLRSAKATLRSARGAFIPTISASPSYSHSSTSEAGEGRSTEAATSVMVTASVPLFSGGSNWITMRQDKYAVMAAQQSLDDSVQMTLVNTQKDFVSVKSSQKSFTASVQSVKSAEAALEQTEMGYKAGRDTIYDILTNLNAVVTAKKSVITNLYDYFANLTSLKLEVGTLSSRDVLDLNSIFTVPVQIPSVNYEG